MDKETRIRLEEEFVERLYKFGVIETYDLHMERGKINGYPMCCILYYISAEKEFGDTIALSTDLIYGWDEGYDYVRCPQCRRYSKLRKGKYDDSL